MRVRLLLCLFYSLRLAERSQLCSPATGVLEIPWPNPDVLDRFLFGGNVPKRLELLD